MSTNGVPEVLKSKGVSAETVKALSAFKDEPAWLTEKRLEAWRVFEEMPMPSLRDEAWRYTDISDVRVEDFLPYYPSPDVARVKSACTVAVGEVNSAPVLPNERWDHPAAYAVTSARAARSACCSAWSCRHHQTPAPPAATTAPAATAPPTPRLSMRPSNPTGHGRTQPICPTRPTCPSATASEGREHPEKVLRLRP